MKSDILSVSNLTMADAALLAERVRAEDVKEAACMGRTPAFSLGYAAFTAAISDLKDCRAMAVHSSARQEIHGGKRIVGAFGFSKGAVWSLVSQLTLREGIEVMEKTPEWCRWCNDQSRFTPLYNIVMKDNHPALRWLLGSNCFDVDMSSTLLQGGEEFYRFKMKPNGKLPL